MDRETEREKEKETDRSVAPPSFTLAAVAFREGFSTEYSPKPRLICRRMSDFRGLERHEKKCEKLIQPAFREESRTEQLDAIAVLNRRSVRCENYRSTSLIRTPSPLRTTRWP